MITHNIFRNTMKLSVLVILALASSTTLFGASDSVQLGPGYMNDVFYQFGTQKKTELPSKNWDIAFEVPGFSSSIITNSGNGVRLWAVPNSTYESFAKPVDTNAVFKTPELHNSFTNWSSGAFNRGIDFNTGDFGWGEYNSSTHAVSGTTLFVIQLLDKQYRQILIDVLQNKTYTIRVANIDGSNAQNYDIRKDDFMKRNFAYFSLVNAQTVQREPVAEEWDLLFGTYTGLSGQAMDTPYPVRGVLANRNVQVAMYKGPNRETIQHSTLSFDTSYQAIGYDWKSFNGTAYDIDAERAYFVKRSDGRVFRLWFTEFKGSSNGNISFDTEEMIGSSVRDGESPVASMSVYPNPAPRGECVVVLNAERSAEPAVLKVYNILGDEVSTQSLTLGKELTLTVHDLQSGVYTLCLQVGKNFVSRKLIVD